MGPGLALFSSPLLSAYPYCSGPGFSDHLPPYQAPRNTPCVTLAAATAVTVPAMKISLSEIQLVLTQHTQDELLLRRLAKAVAQLAAKRERSERSITSRPPFAAASAPALRARKEHPGGSAGGVDVRGRKGRGGGSDSGCVSGGGGNDDSLQPQEDCGSLTSSTMMMNVARAVQWSSGGGDGDDESSEITMPVRR